MFSLGLLLLSVLHDACATPTPRQWLSRRDGGVFQLRQPKATTSKRDLEVTENVLNLNEIKATTRSSRALLSASSNIAPLRLIESGVSYAVNVGFSGQTFALLFDTGSSDAWVAQTGFQCYALSGSTLVPVPEGQCDFGPLYSGGFTEGKVPNEHANIPYGSGEVVAGRLGYDAVTVAGVTVDHQEFALIQDAYWIGDGITSGLIGFAYSSLTSAYKGNNLNGHNQNNLVHYTNFIGNAVKQGKIDPLFSIVLERNGGQSQLALGGLPSISFNHDFTTVPLQIYEFSSSAPIEAKKYTFYTIDVGGFTLSGKNIGSTMPVIVDSGTTLMYLPGAIAEKINAAFDPPAKVRDGLYETSCDATPPSFSVRIGGTAFGISAAELLPPKTLSYDSSTGLCVTGVQSSTALGSPPILGGTFLKNVVAVFDIGASEMRFASHENY